MRNNFINQIKMAYASPEKRLDYETQTLAEETVDSFDDLQRMIKDGEYVLDDNRKITQDREEFLRDNADTQVDQNVNRNTDTKRAMWLLCGVMIIGTIFSVKGLKFFFGEFYGSMNIWVAIVVAMLLAALLVVGSIVMNHFSEQQKGKNQLVYIHAKVAAYVIVLFLPIVNLIEGFNSNYSKTVMSLNIIAVFVDVLAHTALVTMYGIFITAENSKIAINKLRQKDKAQRKSDMELRSLNDTFIKKKNNFSKTASRFLQKYMQLEAQNVEAARNVLFLFPNFLIWMINNKVMQNALLRYHTNENGQPVIERYYFTPENDAIRRGWDQLSSINGYHDTPQNLELNNTNSPIEELPISIEQQNQQQANNNAQHQNNETDANQQLPLDYNSILDDTNPNPNDKIL